MKFLKKTTQVTLLLFLSLSHGHAQIRNGFNTSSLAANDDGSTGAVQLGFDINFFGEIFSTTFVNNNGNITFDAPLSEYTPADVALPTTAMIAPFFGDVDTRAAGSSLVTYGNGIVDGRTAFGVKCRVL